MILDSPIISGSLTQQAGQTAEIPRYTAVSSSFLAASASFDARIDSIESTTASFSPRINALESFTASANATYVNVSGDSMTGGLTITGSLIVTDRITAQEFHTEYVSSSVVFQSGSTKFGDSGDDVHSFTGSVEIDGNVIASNLEGVFSSSAQITGSLGNYYIVSGTITQTTWDNIANKPGGIVSGSSQLTSSYDERYVISGSITQTTWDNIANKPSGIVSGAAQVTESLDLRYRLVGDDITFAELTFKPTLISGSSQLDGTTIQNLSGSFSGSFSGSYRGDGSQLTGLAAGAKFHTQSEPASTWTFVHNLSTQYPNVTVYGSNNNIILPQSINALNANTLVLEFGTPVSGYATAGIGGTIEVNGRTIKQYFTSSLNWRFEHNIGDRFVSIQTYDSGYEKIIPQTIALTDTTSSVITFPEATEGWAIGTIGGDLPAISASYGGYVLQVSQNAPYTASWTQAANVTVTNSVNALTASYLNPISQSLIPAVSGTYDLGSQSNPWKHIYVGTGSIYLVDNTGTIVKTLTGDSIVTNDNLSSLNAFTASNFTTNTFTSSTNLRLISLEEKTGSLATTGSNTFYGTQTITGSLYISSDLIVQGSSSLQNITASAVSIGTNIVNLNTANPAIRYAGLSIGDSGSIGGSGSFLYDSVQDEMIFVHRGANTTVTSSVVLMGPQTYDSIGNETYPTLNIVQKGTGNEHLGDSCIFDNGTTTCVKNNLITTGTITTTSSACFGSNVCVPLLKLNGSANIILNSSFTASSNLRSGGSIQYSKNFSIFSDDGINGCGFDVQYWNGTSYYPSLRINNVASGFSNLLLMQDGGNVGTGITPVDKLHVNGNIISEGCFFSGAPDNLRIFAGHWSTVSGNSNCYLVFQAGGGSASFGTPTGWGGSASIYTLNQTRLSINCMGVACFSNTVCAASTYLGGCASVGGTTYDFGFEVYSSKNTAITSNNTFGANLNFIFNRDNTGGTRKCFNILTDQNAAYLRALGNFPIVISTSHTCGDLGIVNANGYGWIYAQDANHSIILRGNRNGTAADYTNYYQYGGSLASGKGHLFWTGGVLASQSLKMQIADDGIQVSVNFAPSANNTYCLGTSTCAWAHIYTNDLHLSNEGKCGGNDVDGTNGNWTIQEGAENLYIINNKNSKKFKIKLEEII